MTDTTTVQSKSYLQRPEGKFGVFLLLMMAGGVLAGLYFLLPFLVVILTNLLYAGLLCMALGVMSLPLIDKRLRTILVVYYKAMTRWLLGKAIELDPINILRERVKEDREHSEEFQQQIDNLQGNLNGIARKIQERESQAQEALNMAKAAKAKKGMETAFMLQSRQYDRLIQANKDLVELRDRMARVLTMLKRMKEYTDAMVTDMEQTVAIQSEQRKMLLAGYSAYKAAKSIIAGDADEREMFDMAIEKLTDEYNTKMASIENFAEASKGFLQTFDLKNDAAEAQMLARIEQLEKQGLASGINDAAPPRVALRVANGSDAPAVAADTPPDSFDDLLRRGAGR